MAVCGIAQTETETETMFAHSSDNFTNHNSVLIKRNVAIQFPFSNGTNVSDVISYM